MSDGNFTIVGLGELLWDLFPSGKQLGGAPANFAYIASLLGDHGIVASRIGTDALGDDAKQRFQQLRLPTDFLQSDPTHRTGTVKVLIDPQDQPHYEISEDAAWDSLEMTSQWRTLAAQAAAVCFGSLAQRSPAARRTIHEFLGAARPTTTRIFDVNLRPPFYSKEILADSIRRASIIKLNQEELPVVLELLESPTPLSPGKETLLPNGFSTSVAHSSSVLPAVPMAACWSPRKASTNTQATPSKLWIRSAPETRSPPPSFTTSCAVLLFPP